MRLNQVVQCLYLFYFLRIIGNVGVCLIHIICKAILLVYRHILLRGEIETMCIILTLTHKVLGSYFYNKKKGEQTKNLMKFLEAIRKLRFQGKLPH